MDAQITAIYCMTDDILKALNHRSDPQQRMTDSEVITTALVAMKFFGGNMEHSRSLLSSPTYIPNMLSKSRFNRRLHACQNLILPLFNCLASAFKQLNSNSIYLIDSFPVSVCDNIRIKRYKIYTSEEYRGYKPSKKRYFYGLKLHLLVTETGQIVEFFFTPGSLGDVDALDIYLFDLEEGSRVYADKAYNDYLFEDIMKEAAGIELMAIRKKNSKRPRAGWVEYLQQRRRKMVETTGSMIDRMLPKSIHAVTAKGFELKAALFVLAHSFNCAL